MQPNPTTSTGMQDEQPTCLPQHTSELPDPRTFIQHFYSQGEANWGHGIIRDTSGLTAALKGATAEQTRRFLTECLDALTDPSFREDLVAAWMSSFTDTPTDSLVSRPRAEEAGYDLAARVLDKYLGDVRRELDAQLLLELTSKTPDFTTLRTRYEQVLTDLEGLLERRRLDSTRLHGLFRTESSDFDTLAVDDLSSGSGEIVLTACPSITLHKRTDFAAVERFGYRLKFWEDFVTNTPVLSLLHSHQHLLKFGAKGAALDVVSAAADALRGTASALQVRFSVPFYLKVPTDLYIEYRNTGQLPERQLEFFYNETLVKRPAAYVVRSSAVYSEDGELLGAGQYATVGLAENATFVDFLAAVKEVYDSVDAAEAMRYRRENNVTQDELMGLVVMALVEGDHAGYVNTIRCQTPQAMDVVHQAGYFASRLDADTDEREALLDFHCSDSHPFVLSRPVTLLDLPEGDFYDPHLLVPADHSRSSLCDQFSAGSVARVALLLEMVTKSAIQMEYVYDQGQIHVVQARALPVRWTQPSSVVFPEQEALWMSWSLGVCDEVLDVIDPGPHWSELAELQFAASQGEWQPSQPEEGLLILSGSFFGGRRRNWEALLPKRGAVLLLRETEDLRGHVETCCLERGLTILHGAWSFNRGASSLTGLKRYFGEGCFEGLFDSARGRMEPLPFAPPHPTRFRVVSNGIEGRLYPVGS
jgi:hypothetical protein